jgi:hypothetical protein
MLGDIGRQKAMLGDNWVTFDDIGQNRTTLEGIW